MNATTFMTKVETSYKGGTYRPYMYAKSLDLYVRDRATDNGNTIIAVQKITNGVVRLVQYGKISAVIHDNLIKDLCVGLYTDELKRNCFTRSYGTAVDLDSYSERELVEMVTKFSAPGARENDPFAKPRTVKTTEKVSKYLYREEDGSYSMNVMTALNHKCRSNASYIVTEQTPDGKIITKTMTHTEFEKLGKVAKSNSYVSNRFAKESAYTKLVEMGVLKDINGPAKTVMFKLKLDGIQQFGGITD